jgi:nitroreductase
MDAIEAIKQRRSIRQYSDKAVPRGVLEQVVDAARFAATARNEQPWEFVVVTGADTLKKLAEVTDYGRFLANARACVAVFCKDTKYYLEDGSAATQNLLVAAAALGLGSCWIAGDKKPYCAAINELLSVPAGYKQVSLVALGYPTGPVPKPQKRELSAVVHWEKF